MFIGHFAVALAAKRAAPEVSLGTEVLVYLASLFGPPPPGTVAVAWTAQAIWLLVAWGYWIDRHRARR